MNVIILPTTKIIPVAGAVNPARKDTGRAQRIATVMRSKRVELALAKGARMSTVEFCLDRKLIKLEN